jgi:hypothetical protein
MSVLLNLPGVVPPPDSVRLTTTAITDIYTATDNNSVVVAIIVANETAGAVNILVDRVDSTPTTWHTYAKPVPANDSVLLSDFPIRLLTGHKIRATASGANALTVSIVRGVIAGRNISGGTMGANA